MKIIGKILSVLLSILLCLVIFVSVLGVVSIRSVNRVLSSDVLHHTLEDIDLSAMMEQFDTLEDIDLSVMMEQFNPPEKGDFVGKLAQSAEIKKFLADYLSGYLHYFITGKGEFDINSLSLAARKEFVDNFIDFCVESSEYDHSLDDIIREQLEAQRAEMEEKASKSLESFLPSYHELNEKLELSQGALDRVSFFFSGKMQWILILVVAVSALLIAVVRFSPYKWLAWSGFSLLFSGILLLTGSLCLNMLVSRAVEDLFVADIIIPMTQTLKNSFVLYGAGLIVGSVLMIVLYFFIRSRSSKDKALKAA